MLGIRIGSYKDFCYGLNVFRASAVRKLSKEARKPGKDLPTEDPKIYETVRHLNVIMKNFYMCQHYFLLYFFLDVGYICIKLIF